MPLALSNIVEHFAYGLKGADAEEPEPTNKDYRPGIGPLDEPVAIQLALEKLDTIDGWAEAETEVKYPNSSEQCDLYIPGEWAIEMKMIRPFYDNGTEDQYWVKNALHPYAKKESAIGDYLKLRESDFSERKAAMVFGYEHTPPKLDLGTTADAIEAVIERVHDVDLGPRVEAEEKGLVHPVHQQLKTFGWKVRS